MGFVFLIHSAILCLLIGEFVLFTFKAIFDRHVMGLPWWLSSNKSACNAGATGDTGSIPGSGRSPGERHRNPLQCSCLENHRDRGAWQATVHRVTKSWTELKQLSMHTHVITGILFIVFLLFLQSLLLHSSLAFFLCGLMTLVVCLDSFLSLLHTYYRFLFCDYHGAYI